MRGLQYVIGPLHIDVEPFGVELLRRLSMPCGCDGRVHDRVHALHRRQNLIQIPDVHDHRTVVPRYRHDVRQAYCVVLFQFLRQPTADEPRCAYHKDVHTKCPPAHGVRRRYASAYSHSASPHSARA